MNLLIIYTRLALFSLIDVIDMGLILVFCDAFHECAGGDVSNKLMKYPLRLLKNVGLHIYCRYTYEHSQINRT